MYVNIHTYIYLLYGWVFVCIYVYMCVYAHKCGDEGMYAGMYVCICVFLCM